MVIGVGQAWRGDDAVGLEIAARLRAFLPSAVTVIEHSGEGASLMEAWAGFSQVVIVDAARSGAPVGTLHRVDAITTSLPSGFFRASSHAFGVAEGIEMARHLKRLPPTLVLHAIEGQSFALGAELSPEVCGCLDMLAARVAAELPPS